MQHNALSTIVQSQVSLVICRQSFNTVHQAQATAEDDEEQVPSEDEANEQAGLEHVGTTSTHINTRSFAVRQEAEESDSSVELDSVDYRNEASQKGGNGGTWRIFIDFLGW